MFQTNKVLLILIKAAALPERLALRTAIQKGWVQVLVSY